MIPVMAERAAYVTMLQRSPSYVISLPAIDPLAGLLERVLPAPLAYRFTRWKNIWVTLAIYGYSRRRPAAMRRMIRNGMARRLPRGFDVETHFNPSYEPWDQRMCIVPDGDLFDAISDGKVSVVTDRIETFTETGLTLASGATLEADVIVTATGLSMIPIGGAQLSIDGRDVDLGATLTYRGMQLSGVPNMAFAFGYANQSWTLGADLTAEQVCKILQHMDRHGYAVVTPRNHDPGLTREPIVDLTSGYIMRSIEQFPKQGSKDPWRREQHYARNRRDLERAGAAGPALEFTRAAA
jgi:cation diffusion facilitator CzcD-associated flavoprotein CzcO